MSVFAASAAVTRPFISARDVEVIRITAVRALRVRYRGTALGVLWSFANPVLMTFLYTAIFGTTFARSYDGSTTRYLLSVFVAVVTVTFFLQATSDALVSVVTNGSLLNKIALQPSVFPLASIAANGFQQVVTSFPSLLLIAIVVTHDPVRVVLLPLMLAMLLLLVAGFGLALSALYVFFRDLPYVWNVAGFILWLTSPVFYPIQVVPPAVRAWMAFNPIALAVAALREVTVTRGPMDFGVLLTFMLTAAAAAVIGIALFARTRPHFMDLL
jgi:lipopolysaccharide transport system permease protein